MVVLLAMPLAVVASHTFTDVPDSNVFHDDISWLAEAGVTLGCNPPENTRFCPSDNVTREQMSAFMRRLAENQVVDAATVEGKTAADLEGQRGPRGPEGTPGPEGPQGPEGPPGTANVQYSPWFALDSLDNEFLDGTWIKGQNLSVPALTGEILTSGSLQIHMRFANRIWELPYRSRAGGTYNTIDFYAEPGELRIYRVTDGCNAESCLLTIGPSVDFRYVITPGGVEIPAPSGAAEPGGQSDSTVDG